MKSKVKIPEKPIAVNYPRLGMYEMSRGLVYVLFYEYDKGIVVNSQSPDYLVGYHSTQWGEFKFTILPEGTEVTLIQ